MRKINRNSLSIVTPPAEEPVTLQEAKDWCKIPGDAEDSLVSSLIKTARLAGEKYTRRAFITQTLKLTLDRFPGERNNIDDFDGVVDIAVTEIFGGIGSAIELYRPPLISVSSIKTYSRANAESTFSSSYYSVDTEGGRVSLNDGYNWPSDLRDYAAIVVQYTAGYGAASAVPQDIKTAILQHVFAMYQDRIQCEMPEFCKGLYDQYRVTRIFSNG